MTTAAILQNTFIALISLFITGGVGSLFFRKSDRLANAWSSIFAICASMTGLLFAALIFLHNQTLSFSFDMIAAPMFSISFHIDELSAFFIFTISLISLFCSLYAIGYAKHFYGKYNIGALGFFYHTFILGMIAVVSGNNALFFLIGWELMSIASYFLVVYDRNDNNNVKAGFLYLVMTHVGTAFIMLAFLLAYKFTGSFDFTVIAGAASAIPPLVKNSIFVLAIIGFGTKSGIIPFHVWLPEAHPAAPSSISALMSGVMIKTGIYMLIRVLFEFTSPSPLWWGVVIVAIGAVSSLLGVLYALTEHDIKRLLAYHSVENIGIILLGIGSAVMFLALGKPAIAAVALIAGLYHTMNHAIFKTLLFFGAGAVVQQTKTTNMEEYGGLIKRMPQTAFYFLIGSLAIAGVVPFNGFVSEWLTFQTLFQGISGTSAVVKVTSITAVAALVFTGGLAAACFVK